MFEAHNSAFHRILRNQVGNANADAIKDEQDCVHKKLKQFKSLPRKASLHMTRDCIHAMTKQGPKTLPINSEEIYRFAIFRQQKKFPE